MAPQTGRSGVLVDLTKCIGCRSCQVACKVWNGNEAKPTTATASYTNPPAIQANTFTHVRFVELTRGDSPTWNFVKTQCMHCIDPTCAASCPVNALKKTAGGPVAYDQDKCFGCRYCMAACPFGMIGYEWEKLAPRARKCTFCEDRQAEGKKPACVSACPSGALTYGDRDQLLEEAHRRIAAGKGKYVNYVYGEQEAGGTSWLYVSPIPFEKLGFRMNVPKESLPQLAWASVSKTPAVVGGLVVALAGIAAFRNRAAKEGK
jgi:formate dehydrogenase iron-sulfur subunit